MAYKLTYSDYAGGGGEAPTPPEPTPAPAGPGYRLKYSDYPGTAEGPPDPARWEGPPGPPGPSGPPGPAGPSYTLPVASTSVLGGVKIDGSSITISDGTISSASVVGGPFLPLSGGTVTGAPGVTATSGFFGGIANPGMRAGGAALTWVGKSDNGQMQYYDELSASAFYAQPGTGLAVVSAVRSSDVGLGYAGIGMATYVTSDSTVTNAAATWGFYTSNRRLPGATAQTICAEFTMGNLAPTAEVNAYYYAPGFTVGLWLSSGSEAHTAGATLYPGSVALGIVSNGSSWAKGIVIRQNAIAQNAAGTYTAIQFPAGHEVQWIVDGVNTRGAFIRSDATTAANTTGILFNNTGFHVVDAAIEGSRFSVSATGAIAATALSIRTTYSTGGVIYAGAATYPSDLANHIDLTGGGTYGINSYGNAVNYCAASGGSHAFLVNNAYVALINSTGINTTPIGQTTAAAGSFTTLTATSTPSGAGFASLLSPYAPLASPAFTGTPSLPTGTVGVTQTAGTSNTTLATTAFVGAAVGGGGYTLPTASTTVLGGVKIDGSTVTIASGVISAVVPAKSVTTPIMDGTAAIGSLTTYALADHIHPTDTSRYAATNPSGYQTAAQVTAVLPVVNTATTPLVNGTAAIGTLTTYARPDHVHPTDTSRAPTASPTFTGTVTAAATNVGAFTATGITASPISGSTGSFTTLAASSTVSGVGFSTYLASPPAIGGTAAAAGSFTTLAASGAVSGAGFSTYLASPPAIGGTAAAAGSFTTLAASSTVSGTGFTNRFAAPGPVGNTTASTGKFTTLEMVAGITFDTPAASATDLTQHLNLAAGTFGINYSGGIVNYLVGAGGGYHTFLVNGTAVAYIAGGGSVQAVTSFGFAGGGPTWTTGSGVPSSTQPVGSIYSRVTTWSAGATLYVSKGAGAWTAVASV